MFQAFKIPELGLFKTKKFLYSEGNSQQSKEITQGIKENICKPHLQRIETEYLRLSQTQTTQLQK